MSLFIKEKTQKIDALGGDTHEGDSVRNVRMKSLAFLFAYLAEQLQRLDVDHEEFAAACDRLRQSYDILEAAIAEQAIKIN